MPLPCLRRFALALCVLVPALSVARPPSPAHQPPRRISHVATGLCLTADDRGRGRNAGLQLDACDGGRDQLWTIEHSGEVTNVATRECLELGDGRARGSIGLGRCGQPDQRWQLVGRKGTFALRNSATRTCMDVAGRRGERPVMSTCDQAGQQRWAWLEAPPPPPPPPPPPALVLLNQANGLCLDAEGANGKKKADVTWAPCDRRADQNWQLNVRGELVNGARGMCLDATGKDGAHNRKVRLDECRGQRDQQWDAVARGNAVVLRNRARGLCLDIEHNGKARLKTCNGRPDQSWTWADYNAPMPPRPPPTRPPPAPVPQPTQPMIFVNQAQGLCLDAKGRGGPQGANVALWDCDGGRDQLWSFDTQGRVLNAARGLCLDAAGTDGARQRNVALWQCDGRRDQQWDLVSTGPVFTLRNRARGMCLDVDKQDGARGRNVLLRACDQRADQSWARSRPIAAPQPPRHQPPRHQPRPPPPPPQPAAMAEHVFDKVLDGMRRAAFSRDKLQAFEIGVNGQFLTCSQVARAVKLANFSSSKVRIVEISASRILDKHNREDLVRAFTFPSDQRKVRELLK